MNRPSLAYGNFALRRERQIEGIAKAKAAGVYKGRPASIDAAQVRAMKAQGLGASEIAKALKIGRASVYRVLDAGLQFRRRGAYKRPIRNRPNHIICNR
jgi:DNA invertase Pin-like site-specific DNA recombinase